MSALEEKKSIKPLFKRDSGFIIHPNIKVTWQKDFEAQKRMATYNIRLSAENLA